MLKQELAPRGVGIPVLQGGEEVKERAMSDTTTPKGQALTPAIGGLYNWKGQPERLVYMGARRYPGDPRPWHQFAKVEAPHMCWSEVLTSELAMFEETKGTK